FPNATGFGNTFSPDVKGWVFGGQVGYNWQVNANIVVGVEGDLQATGERASTSGSRTFLTPISSDFHLTTTQPTVDDWKFPWFATFRGRGGVLVGPQTLLYATGGLAVGEIKVANSFVSTSQLLIGQTTNIPAGPAVTVASAFSSNTTRVGGAIGAG